MKKPILTAILSLTLSASSFAGSGPGSTSMTVLLDPFTVAPAELNVPVQDDCKQKVSANLTITDCRTPGATFVMRNDLKEVAVELVTSQEIASVHNGIEFVETHYVGTMTVAGTKLEVSVNLNAKNGHLFPGTFRINRSEQVFNLVF